MYVMGYSEGREKYYFKCHTDKISCGLTVGLVSKEEGFINSDYNNFSEMNKM